MSFPCNYRNKRTYSNTMDLKTKKAKFLKNGHPRAAAHSLQLLNSRSNFPQNSPQLFHWSGRKFWSLGNLAGYSRGTVPQLGHKIEDSQAQLGHKEVKFLGEQSQDRREGSKLGHSSQLRHNWANIFLRHSWVSLEVRNRNYMHC